MADQWIKYYKKLPFKLQKKIDDFVVDLKNDNIGNYDVKKLEGTNDQFRVRFGDIRLVYQKLPNTYIIKKIGHRGDIYK